MNEIKELRKKLTHPEFIEYIKSHGELIEHKVIGMPHDKYAEPVIMKYNGLFFIFYEVLANFHEEVFYFDEEEFKHEYHARKRYELLLENLQN